VSRGLGSMQRAILEVYDRTDGSTPQDVGRLRHQVAALRGTGWCTKYPELIAWHRFEASFSRALHTLIRRGILEASPPLEDGQPVEAVKRRKC
jgi:hypothetical protein